MFSWLKKQRGYRPDDNKPFGDLRPGKHYHVVQPFVDHDGILHAVGERWTLLRSSFLRYEDGLSLFVAVPGGGERQIRLQWRLEAQGAIVDALGDYVLPVPLDAPGWTLVLTRDSVCAGDDVDAPHAFAMEFAPDADAAGVATAILDAHYLAWVGSDAAWSLAIGPDRVLFGYRAGERFVMPVGDAPLTARTSDVDRLHVGYLAQRDPGDRRIAMLAATKNIGRAG